MNFIFFFFFGAVHAPTVYGLIIFPCNIALISRVLPLLLLFFKWPCGVVVARLPHTQEDPGSTPGRGSYLRQVSLH